MKNILLILKHEYITRVSKKSFIIMTLIGPLLIALFYGSIIGISVYQLNSSDTKVVLINDPYNSLNGQLPEKKNFSFFFDPNLEDAKQKIEKEDADILLDIQNRKGDSIELIAKKSQSIGDKDDLKSLLSSQLFKQSLKSKGLSSGMIDSMKVKINLKDRLLTGQNGGTEIKSLIGYLGAFVIYLFIFMYGVMIMRGVTEEKNNRIVEIIVSAVKPFELMMGKILGVALVGLTQFLSWIILSGGLLLVISFAFGASQVDTSAMTEANQQIQMAQNNGASGMIMEMTGQLKALNLGKIIVGFVLFFFGGFLLYSSLFAAIGSAVDSDTETQQFMFPVSMPLIFGIAIAQIAVLKDPNSSLAFWTSMFPFTSPVVMMVRLPFDVSWWEIFSSAGLLFAFFFLFVWLAGRIYRIGILSYGQKASYKQMFKWLISKG
ncbi:MAG TPA: ABC transporter permease [Bacteroidia bacterium]